MPIQNYPPLQLTAARIAAAGGLIGQTAVLQADFPKVNATFANVTDLTLNLLAGHWYRITGSFAFDFGIGSGKLDFAGGSVTATGLNGTVSKFDPDGGTWLQPEIITALNAAITWSSANTTASGECDFTIQVNAGGTLIPRFAQGAADASTSTLLKYSTIQAIDVTPA